MARTSGRRGCVLFAVGLAMYSAGCSPSQRQSRWHRAPTVAEDSSAFRIYVTNEVSGDLTVIGSNGYKVLATIPLGKRPRGIHSSPDHKTIYVALSGSPIGGPDVDESTLPPPDHSADGKPSYWDRCPARGWPQRQPRTSGGSGSCAARIADRKPMTSLRKSGRAATFREAGYTAKRIQADW